MRLDGNYARSAARALELVEPFVRRAQQIAFLIAILRMHGDAEIERHANFDLKRDHVALIERADAAAQRDGLLCIGLRQEQHKFIAADAEGEVGGAQRLAQSGRRELQHLIPAQMPVPVVHFLEPVKIQNHDGEMLAVAFRAVQFLVAIFVKEPPIVEPGQSDPWPR